MLKGEEELTKSKAYTESIVQNFSDTLIVVDAEARIQTVNPATCRLLGYTEEEVIGQPVGIIFEEEEVHRVFQFFREPEKAEAPRPQDTIRNRQLTYKTKDGRLIPMLFNASVLTDEGGSVTGVVAVAKDITELRPAATALRREKVFSQNIVATVPDSLLVLDKDLRIKSANRTFYETFQTEPEKVIGSSITDILGDEDGRLSAELTRLFGTGDMLENLELLYQSEILGERIFNVTARGMLVAEEEEEEEEEEELVVLQDITIRERAEEALRESEEKYRSLVESTEDSIYLVDRDCRYLFVNNTHLSRIGLSMEEIRGRRYGELHSEEEDTKEFAERVEEVFETGKSVPHEHRSRRDNRYFLRTFSPVNDSEGRTTAVTVVSKDITERKQAERRIEHLNLVLRAIRNVNQLITREKDRDRLLKGASETLIETRGYHHAWIAIFDESGGLVTTAQAGLDILPLVEYLRRGELPVCAQRALQQSGIVVMEEAPSDCADCPLAAEHPGTMTMTVRLAHAGKVYGVLNVSLVPGLNAHEEEEALFEEVAGDIALALHGIELEEEHRQAQKRLRESEEKHRTILENIEEGYYEIDIAGNFTFFNDSLCRMFGYPPDELMGMNNRQYTDKKNAKRMYQAFNTVYRTGETAKAFDWEIIRKDGTKRFVEASVSLISDPAGQPAGFRGIVRDVTERKRMQREIEERREYLASVLRNAPDAIVTFDAANRIVEWNPGAKRLYGYTYDEVVGRDIDDVAIRPDVREQAILFTEQMLSGKEIPPTEVVRYRKDGTPVSVILAGSPIIIGDELRGAVAVYTDITERKRAEEELQQAHDTLEMRVQERTADLARANESLRAEITERKRAEEALRESEEKYRGLVTNVKLGIFRHSAEVGGRILEANPAMEEITGYSRDELLGKQVFDLYVHPEERGSFLEELAATTGKITKEQLFRKKDGTEITVSTTKVAVRDDAGKILYVDGILEDITERKRAEEDLRAKEMQLIHAGRLSSLGEMATGVAHEINQPLAIISMAAEGRLRDIRSGRFDVSILPQELEDILKNVRRIDRIITHMRTFARRTGELESADPEKVLDNVFILLGEQFRMHQISISREIEEGLPGIKVDTNQLEQVFVNILTNARQVLDEKAEKAARCGEAFEKRLVCSISRESREGHEYVAFGFADNAFGVPDELKTRLFDPFFTTKEAGQGTGLGLSIAYSIVTRALGGKIWVEDNEMGGASFKVALPAEGEVRE
ncbi:PAS domain S-box protein [Dehalococcoidia bacterium]|nr:PAS domain S-box protein [Dehalococcoidia bacterium]